MFIYGLRRQPRGWAGSTHKDGTYTFRGWVPFFVLTNDTLRDKGGVSMAMYPPYAGIRDVFANTFRTHYTIDSDGNIQRFERVPEEENPETNLSRLQQQPSLLSPSEEEVDRNPSTGLNSSNLFINPSMLTAHAISAMNPESHTISFNGQDGEAILKLYPNGDIFVNGRLATNDRQVVEGMRQLLGQRNLM